jgi:hypothetical protein
MTTALPNLVQIRDWFIDRCRGVGVIYCSLLVLVLISWFPRLSGPIDLRRDASIYYILGTSLAEGKGYRLLNEPGEIEATQYPPLLSLIVAAHQWVLGTNDPIIVGRYLRLSFCFLHAIYIFAVFSMMKNHLPVKYAFIGTIICYFSLYSYLMSNMLAPEIPYTLVTALFVLCHYKNGGRISSISATFFAVAAYLLRTIGITLLAAWIVENLLNRKFKQAATVFSVSLILIFFWQYYIYSVESGSQYKQPFYKYQRADYLFYNVSYAKNIFRLKNSFSPESGYASVKDIAYRFVSNLTRIPKSLGETITSEEKTWYSPFFRKFPWTVSPVLLFLGCLIIGGIALQLIRREWFIPIYILLSLAVICFTPWPIQFVRYLMPLTPFLVIAILKLILVVKDRYDQIDTIGWKTAGSAVGGLLALLVITQQLFIFFQAHFIWHDKVIYSDLHGETAEYRVFGYYDSERERDGGLDWLLERADQRDVIAGATPGWNYVRTGFKSIIPPFELDPVKAQAMLDSIPVRYLLLEEGFTKKYTYPVIVNFNDRWKLVYSNSDTGFNIYQRVHPVDP